MKPFTEITLARRFLDALRAADGGWACAEDLARAVWGVAAPTDAATRVARLAWVAEDAQALAGDGFTVKVRRGGSEYRLVADEGSAA